MKRKNIIILILIGIIFFSGIYCFKNKKVYFSLIGDNDIKIDVNEKYKDDGYYAKYCSKYFKLFCKDISKDVKVTKNVKSNKSYSIVYNLKYNNENKVLTRNVYVDDLESPEITLVDSGNKICPNKAYIEEGYSAFDNVDGDLTNNVLVERIDNKIYYTVSDSSGNKKTVFRDINYKDDEAPKINLNGDKTYIYKGTKYEDTSYSAYDNCDGDITNNVIVSNVDTSKTGEYNIDYSVTDSSGNKTIVTKKVIVYNDLSEVPKNGKVVYLTFDDGPCSYTSDILKILDKYNVKATFFVTNQFSSYQYVIGEEFKKGHAIAVHTYSHVYEKVYNSVEDYVNDFDNMNSIIYEQTGTKTKMFRFPGGSSNTISRFNKGIVTNVAKKMTELGYYYYDWNVDSEDVSNTDPVKIKNNVLKGIEKHDASVVLLHDIKKANIESVDMIIKEGLEKGYTFLPLDINSPTAHHSINN